MIATQFLAGGSVAVTPAVSGSGSTLGSPHTCEGKSGLSAI